MLATRTEADMMAGANTFSLSAIGGANATATVDLRANNDILLNAAELVGRDVKLFAGQSRDRVPNIILGQARADMAMISLLGISVPIRSVTIAEHNHIELNGASQVRAIGNVDLLAEKGMGSASLRGSVLNLSPIGLFAGLMPSGDEIFMRSNQVLVGDAARVEAGMNYKTVLSIQPYTVAGQASLVGSSAGQAVQASRIADIKKAGENGLDLSQAEKAVLGLDAAQSYHYVALELKDVSIGITTGSIVELVGTDYGKGVAGAAYQLTPGSFTDLNLVLDKEDYTNTSRWTRITPTHKLDTTGNVDVAKGDIVRSSDGRWFKRSGDALTIDAATESFSANAGWLQMQVQTSDKGKQLARELSDDFYVVKPKDVVLPSLVYANVANQLFEDRAKIVGWITSHAGNAEAIARYQALLEKIDGQLEKMGLASTAGGSDTVLPRAQFDQLFLRLPTIEASPGLIYIAADEVSRAKVAQAMASGRMLAHDQANISIKNETPFGLEVNDVGIRKTSRVETLNGALLTLNPGTTYFNKAGLSAAGAGGQSVIRITQDALPKEAYGVNGSLGALSAPSGPQDLYVRGKIANADGALYLTNMEGSINVTGEIRAASVNISATGDFNLSTEDWFHTGADPRQYLDFNAEFGTAVYNADGKFKGAFFDYDDERVTDLVAAIEASVSEKKSLVFAMGAIDINARYLNINGTLQSGVDNIELTIADNFAPANSSNFTDALGKTLSGISYGTAGLSTVDGYFDANTGTIILDDIKPTGGVISLTGTIVSTGQGSIKVASGYASIKIDNKSKYALATGLIDASENRVGKVTITDSGTLKREVFTFENGNYRQEQFQGVLSVAPETAGLSSIVYTSRAVSSGQLAQPTAALNYQPELGRYYVWTEGQAKTQTKLDIYEERSFNLLGFDWNGLVPDRAANSTDTRFTDGAPLLESELVLRSTDIAKTLGSSSFDAAVWVEYQQKSNQAIDLVKDKSLVRDVKTNILYTYVGASGKLQFPVISFGDTTLWKFDQQLSGGKSMPDPAEPFTGSIIKATDQAAIKMVDVSGKTVDWSPKKANESFESDFANQEITTDVKESGGGWLREKVITTKVTTVTGLKDFYTYGLKADLPIKVSTLVGAAKPTVSVLTTGKLLLRGSISIGAVTAPDDADAQFTPMALSADALEVGGNVVISGALPDIVANSDVTITVKDPAGKLNIRATGNVVVNHLQDRDHNPLAGNRGLKIGQVIAATYVNNAVASAGNVTINSVYGIEDASVLNSRIVGERVELNAGAGSIRVSVDSRVLGQGGVTAKGAGRVTLTEMEGDMVLIAPTGWEGASVLSTASDVQLSAKKGAILDGVYERTITDVSASLEVLKATGFSDAQLAAAGLGDQALMADKARYAMAPDLVKVMLPHQDLLGQGQAAGAERLNIQGQNIVLLSEGLSAVNYGVGRSSERVTINNPGDFSALSTANKALLSQASATDLVEARYRRYQWLGADATVDLSALAAFYNPQLWGEVGSSATAPVNLAILGSSEGIAELRHGQWVDNQRELLSVTIQLTDDLNISATGDVAVKTAGDAVRHRCRRPSPLGGRWFYHGAGQHRACLVAALRR